MIRTLIDAEIRAQSTLYMLLMVPTLTIAYLRPLLNMTVAAPLIRLIAIASDGNIERINEALPTLRIWIVLLLPFTTIRYSPLLNK